MLMGGEEAVRAKYFHHSSADSDVPFQKRLIVFLIIAMIFAAFVVISSALTDSSNPRTLYLLLLFVLCGVPFLTTMKLNGPFGILMIFTPYYFIAYACNDVFALLPGFGVQSDLSSTGLLSKAEFAILTGLLLLIVGYYLSVGLVKKRLAVSYKEMSPDMMLFLGFVAWLLGYIGTLGMQFLMDQQKVLNITLSSVQMGAMVAGRMIEPMGVMLVAYRFVVAKSRMTVILLVLIIVSDFILGFIGDSKELSIRSPLIVIMTMLLVNGSVPKKWLFVTTVFCLTTFSVFQAYRLEVLQLGRQERVSAAKNIRQNLKSLSGSQLLEGGLANSGVREFVTRVTLKPVMIMMVNRVGEDVQYQNGKTIILLLYSVIPRFVWPNKPDMSVGQVVNRQFGISWNQDTYISSTLSGEFYWNFGWYGMTIGLFAIGMLLGWVGALFSLTRHRSVISLLVLVTTIYLLCLRWESGFAIQYTLWWRSLVMIWLMKVMFARVNVSPGLSHADRG